MDSFADDEMCDLETLEALLNDDDDNVDNADNADRSSFSDGNKEQRENGDSCKKSGLSDELLEFMNAESDDSDEENITEKSSASPCSVKQTSGGLNGSNSPNFHKSKMRADSLPSKKSSPKANNDTSSTSHQKSSHNNGGTQTLSEPKNDPSTTLNLMEEMAKMQKKMEELQKLLQAKQDEDKKDRVIIKQETVSKSATPASKDSSTQPVPKSVSKMRLMAEEDEGNLFFNQDTQKKSPNSSSVLKESSSTGVLSLSDRKEVKPKALSQNRNFDDSDSDWEDLDGDNQRNLSEEGKNIKRLLKVGEKRKESFGSKFDGNFLSQSERCAQKDLKKIKTEKKNDFSGNKTTLANDKRSLQCSSSSTDQCKPVSQKASDTEKVVTEDFSRIRIVNPLISSSVMQMRMEGRKLITVSRIHAKLNTPDLQSDWVTIGVVVSKSNAKASSSGKSYSIWKLSDLHDLDHCVSFFLFGQVHKNHWKLDVGSVIGLLNPSMMEAMEKGKSEPAFTIKNPNQLMVMGLSKDLGWCMGRTKKGNKCSHFLNKRQGDYCAYHVQAAYKKTSAQRLEFHGSVTGVKPKSFESKIFSKNCAYMYGGNTFVPNSSSSKSKNAVTLSELQQKIKSSRKQVNTFSIQDIKPSLEKVAKERKIEEDKNDLFMDMISVPSPGSMNLVAHLKKNETVSATHNPNSTKTANKMESISAGDLLKQHRQQMKMRQSSKPKASELLMSSGDSQKLRGRVETRCDPLKQAPVLGKGFNSGEDINLMAFGRGSKALSLADRSKLKAIQSLRNKGGLLKEDPNAIRKTKAEKDVEAIKKRVDKKHSDETTDSSKSLKRSRSQPSTSHEPQVKKSRFLGDVDLNSDEVKAILKAKSKHVGALTEKEAEREEAYFDNLEKKEMLEEKLQSVTSIEISVFTCKQCHYTAQSALEQCKKEQHSIVKSKAKKRFFKCKKCKQRTNTINGLFPSTSCQKCGSLCYEKTSMYKEKSGPKLDSEILSHRGDEVKFLNSLDHKVFMNTVVD